MRDPNRIDRIIERLREVWHASPDMRLGQLVVNVLRPSEPCPRVFYAEDTDTEAKLAEYPTPNQSGDGGNTLQLTRAEALVLFEFVNRFTDTNKLNIEHPAEAQILWNVCALLERQIAPDPSDLAWSELVAQARSTVRPDTNE